jgi:hypothetical protein
MRPIFAAVIVALLAPALPGSAAEPQSRIYPEAADIPSVRDTYDPWLRYRQRQRASCGA